MISSSDAQRAVRGDQFGLARSPHRHHHRDGSCIQAAASRDRAAREEDVWRVGVEEVPPLEQAPWVVDGRVKYFEPRGAKSRLVIELSGYPLGSRPDAEHRNRAYDGGLADEDSRGSSGCLCVA
jgi:hypothetical protein